VTSGSFRGIFYWISLSANRCKMLYLNFNIGNFQDTTSHLFVFVSIVTVDIIDGYREFFDRNA
jgi:hypothetical protein